MLYNSMDQLIQNGICKCRSRFFIAEYQPLVYRAKPFTKLFLYLLVNYILQNINNQHYEKSH